MKTIEFLFDVGSPTTYLAWTQLPAIAERHGATIDYQPILLGAVHKATNNQSPVAVPAKGKWIVRDLMRFATRYGVPLRFNPNFPINTLQLMRGAMAFRGTDRFHPYVAAVFAAIWVDARDMNDPQVVAETLGAAGFDAGELLGLISQQSTKDALRRSTDSAIERGAFGAPTFFVGGEMHFGQDRLSFVEEAIAS